jgi:hypothetical protein
MLCASGPLEARLWMSAAPAGAVVPAVHRMMDTRYQSYATPGARQRAVCQTRNPGGKAGQRRALGTGRRRSRAPAPSGPERRDRSVAIALVRRGAVSDAKAIAQGREVGGGVRDVRSVRNAGARRSSAVASESRPQRARRGPGVGRSHWAEIERSQRGALSAPFPSPPAGPAPWFWR